MIYQGKFHIYEITQGLYSQGNILRLVTLSDSDIISSMYSYQ